MNRKDLYKQGVHSTNDRRNRRRELDADLRRERREKLLTSKRVRFAEEVEADEENIEEFTVEQVREFAKAIQRHDNNTLHCLRSLRKAFAQGSELIHVFLRVENGLRAVVTHLTGNNVDLQLEAAWCVTNLSAGTHEDTMAVLKASAPYLITYLSGQNLQLQDQCAWALGNMSGDSVECRDMLRSQGIIVPMVNLLKAALTLCNIAYHSPEFVKVILDNDGMTGFVNILKSHDQDTVLTGLQFVEMALRIFPETKQSFEEAEGVACLEGLEYNCNETLRQYANELLDNYFMDGEEEGLGDELACDATDLRSQEINMATSTDDAT
ncbi:hypothetical protein QZH41_017144 [Actinostola sp. cb2023]|nr:hypothetical protein QZH41_017144 [Actinostola sp. cb2023]